MITCCRADGTCASEGNPYALFTPEHRCFEVAQVNGRNAASWAEIDASNAPRILAGIEDGDPEVMDSFYEPSLSGEHADDYSESDLMSDCGYVPHDGTLLRDEIAEQYLAEVSAAFWAEIERRCRYHLGPTCATIGCHAAATDRISYRLRGETVTEDVCAECADSYECRPALTKFTRGPR